MINTIKNYLRIRSNRRCNDYWYKDTLVEMLTKSSEVASYEIWCLDKKTNLLFCKKYLCENLDCNTNEIFRSHMVIIRTSFFEMNIVIKMLGQICKDNNCFGPIVFTADNDVLFFPKLRYHDGYLLKSIIETHLGNKNSCIAYGSNIII